MFGLLLLLLVCAVDCAANYEENVNVRQLSDGKVLLELRFINHETPRPIHEIQRAYDVREMHLSFTQGRWQYDQWGHSYLSASRGAELYAWLHNSTLDWNGLTHALAGQFCSSLNFLGNGASIASPLLTWEFGSFPTNNSPLTVNQSGLSFKYGTLSREAVCTENLTPWIKLLPCKSKSGIAALLNAYKVFDGHFQSIGVHLMPDGVYMQTFAVVMNPLRTLGRNWSFDSLFARQIDKTCPFASKTTVELDVPINLVDELDSVSPGTNYVEKDGNMRYNFQLASVLVEPFNLGIQWKSSRVNYTNPELVPVHQHRYLSGVGQERGGIVVSFTNRRAEPTQITYFECLPWIMKLYLHKFQIKSTVQTATRDDIVKTLLFQPAIDRVRPNALELSLILPPHSTTTFSIAFSSAFVKYTEHHPDSNHGFDIGAGVMMIRDKDLTTNSSSVQRRVYYTDSLLLRVPTPDFSMPYNVITLTCTLFALFVGSVFNGMVRRYKPIIVS